MIFHQPSNSLTNYNYNVAFYTDTVWEHHFHRNLELIYVLRGAVKCTVNNLDYRLTAGQFGLCLPCDIHRYEPVGDSLYWVIVFSEDFVHGFSKIIFGKTGEGFSFKLRDMTREYIESRLINNASPTVFTLKSCLYAVCEEYLENIKLTEKNQKELKAITLISDYVQENYTRKITLRDIAKRTGYDYNYTSRYFHRAFNMKFNDYVNICRLECALRLLNNTGKSITDIAYESGFKSVRSFNDFFRKKMGTSPVEYRKFNLKIY